MERKAIPTLFIGDVHGQLDQYSDIITNTDLPTVCVGDFGFFREHKWHIDNVDGRRHKILFGNHDYYPYVTMPHSIGDWRFDPSGILYIRGAFSIDFAGRMIGRNFFYEEELPYGEFRAISQHLRHYQPHTIVSHDCPQILVDKLWQYGPSKTRRGLDFIFEQWQPKHWIFGHHHISLTDTINGTQFRCLNILETMEHE